MRKIRRYEELRKLRTFEERFAYLRLVGDVGKETFGADRYINQRFYTSWEWKQARDWVISRDLGCDLGVEGYEIHENILVHHMNPIALEDIEYGSADIFDPEFLITTTLVTHNAIHFGRSTTSPKAMIVRRPNDTTLW